MKICPFLFLFLLNASLCWSNMASPFQTGTLSSTAITSRHIDLVHENLRITIQPDYQKAQFDVVYTLRVPKDTKRLPLLFHAQLYDRNFQVWLDGKAVPTQAFHSITDSAQFDATLPVQAYGEMTLPWTEGYEHTYHIDDYELHYFETTISEGIHSIHVRYTAVCSKDLNDWTSKYLFFYALYPATYWHSFGEIDITIVYPSWEKTPTTNLGKEYTHSTVSREMKWHFNHIPTPTLRISYHPPVPELARLLIRLSPMYIALALGILLAAVHIGLHYWHRQRSTHTYSWVALTGIPLVPFFFCYFYISAFVWIDDAIGENASQYHGYTFMIFFFFPFIVPAYGLIIWLLDRWFRKKQVL